MDAALPQQQLVVSATIDTAAIAPGKGKNAGL
jgi:hypothetical protein